MLSTNTLHVAHGDLQVLRSKTNFGDRVFAVTGPASCNRLPATMRSSDTLQNFKNQLKSHFFPDKPFLMISFPFISNADVLELDSMLQHRRN